MQGIRNSDEDFVGLGSGARDAVARPQAQPYRTIDGRDGRAGDPSNGYPVDLGNGRAGDRRNGYPVDLRNGRAGDPSNGYPVDLRNGRAGDPSNGYPVDLRNGRALDRRNGYPVDLGDSFGVLEHTPRRAVDDLYSTLESEPPASLVSEPSAEVVTYPRPSEGIPLPPGRHPVTLARGSGPKLGLRAAIVALAAVVVLAAIGYGVYANMQTPPLTNLSAQVVSTGQVALGFPQSGVLSGIFVHPGEHVAVGQMLATELVAGLEQQVTADRDSVQTDHLVIRQLEALLTEADHQAAASTSSQQQVAAAGISSATAAIGSTLPARQAAISAYQAEINIANQTLQTDESSYTKMCGSSPTGGDNCQALAHEVAADKLSLSSAQANLSAQQAAQADWLAEANRLLAFQQAEQAGLNGNTTLALAPLDVDLANAKSQLVRDQAQLATDKAKKAEGELQAPQAGTVLSVDGALGEVVSGAGVANGNATGGSVTVTPGFELFPAQQNSAGAQASSSPVVVLEVGGPLLANVVVPESQIGLVRVGAPVTIRPKVAGPSTTQGVVTEIFPSSIVAAGVVSYEVQVKVSSPAGMRGWLPGMTATATISR